MKKILLLMLLAPLFLSCSSDDDNKDENDKLEFIQVRVTSEDAPAPNGNVYLFKVNGYALDSDKPNSWAIDYTPVLSYKDNKKSESMLPISEYGTKSKGDLLVNEKEGYSIHSFYWDNLSRQYGQPEAGDEYLIFIELRNGTYARASKRFVITKNSLITVKLPTCTDKSEFVEGSWLISDY